MCFPRSSATGMANVTRCKSSGSGLRAAGCLSVTVCADRATFSHDCSSLIGAAGLSLDENKFAVMQGDGVAFDYVVGKMVIGKMCFKCANDGARVGLGWQNRFRIVPES